MAHALLKTYSGDGSNIRLKDEERDNSIKIAHRAIDTYGLLLKNYFNGPVLTELEGVRWLIILRTCRSDSRY